MGIREYYEEKKKALSEYQRRKTGEARVRDAKQIQELRKRRLAAELDAKLRMEKQKEQKRIEAAQAKGRPVQSKQEGGFRFNVGAGNPFDMGFAPRKAAPQPRRKRRSTQKSSKMVYVVAQPAKKKQKRTSSQPKAQPQRNPFDWTR